MRKRALTTLQIGLKDRAKHENITHLVVWTALALKLSAGRLFYFM